jgi:hypothetical protein
MVTTNYGSQRLRHTNGTDAKFAKPLEPTTEKRGGSAAHS